jgi:hypothetical protein
MVLDLGADPNASGSEFSGDVQKDVAKKAAMYKDKTEEAAE